MVRRLGSASLAFGVVALVAGPLQGVDFIRGDLNSDGRVSMADAYWYVRWLYQGGPAPECMNTIDIFDNEFGHFWNLLRITHMAAADYPGPKSPYPNPGPDPTPNSNPDLTCESYGHGALLEDPKAELSILDAIAKGGDHDRVTLTITISNSSDIVGYSGQIRIENAVVASIPDEGQLGMAPGVGVLRDLSGTLNTDEMFAGACLGKTTGDRLRFGFLNSLTERPMSAIPPGQTVAVAEVEVCLSKGTRAGQYSLTLEAGELVDASSARSIVPALRSGTLTVEADLSPNAGCDYAWFPGPPCVTPESGEASFRLGKAEDVAGNEVSVPFLIRSNSSVGAYTFSIDFNEEVLEATRIERVFRRPDGKKNDFEILEFNNRNATPGNAGIDEGFLLGMVVFLIQPTGDSRIPQGIPADVETEALRIHFRVKPEAPEGLTELRFLNGALPSGPNRTPVWQSIASCGSSWTPETIRSMVFLDGAVKIIDEIVVFVRGDADGNATLDINDAQSILSYLFLGEGTPACYDAADVNDDGTIDIADPIRLLQFLFLDASGLPGPYPELGRDPSEDGMGCRRRS